MSAELRHQLRQRRAALRKRIALDPRLAMARRRRRIKRTVGIVLLAVVVLLLLLRCDDPPELVKPPSPKVAAAEEPGPGEIAPRVGQPVDRPAISSIRRRTLPPARPRSTAWLDALRLQVGARGAALARCFQGVSGPGTLRWSATVDSQTGLARGSKIESVRGSWSVTPTQHRCAVDVLEGKA
ncbi:MAG: hypothetical protein AAFX94_15945, partial [Myxococcota bacterium]